VDIHALNAVDVLPDMADLARSIGKSMPYQLAAPFPAWTPNLKESGRSAGIEAIELR
jgi:hypothetical protein